jgi:prolyl oligopeptidase
VYYHALGTSQDQDVLVHENKEKPDWRFGMYVVEDESYQFLSVSESTSGRMLYVKDARDPSFSFIPISENFDSDFIPIDVLDENVLVLTNYKAPKYRLLSIDPKNPGEKYWKEIIPETESVLSTISLVGGKIIANYLQDAHSVVKAHNTDGSFLHEVKFPCLGTASSFSGKNDSPEAFYYFTSFTYPAAIFKYNVDTNISEIYHHPQVAFAPENYVTEQVFFPGKDGTKVPMFITYKKGMQRNRNNPVLMYGYGGFNISVAPGFTLTVLPFIDNGGIYVNVNLRGGGEYGKEWHKAGT